MSKKKVYRYILCDDCVFKQGCRFKDKDNPNAKVVDLWGVEGISLACPKELGGMPVLPELWVPTKHKNRKKASKEEVELFIKIGGKGLSKILEQIRIKEEVFKHKHAGHKSEDAFKSLFSKKNIEDK